MTPEAQFWEKRHIIWRNGGYHQNDSDGYLKTLDWAIQKHREHDEEERREEAARLNPA